MPDSVFIKRPARLDHIHECLDTLINYAGSHGFTSPDIHNLRLVAEEVLANIVSHAYGKDPGDIEILCRTGPGESHNESRVKSCSGSLLIEFRDSGIPFKFEAPEPDLAADIDERPIGGLGIYIIKTLAEDVRYRRERGKNILTVLLRKSDLKA